MIGNRIPAFAAWVALAAPLVLVSLGSRAQQATNPLLGQWELNGEDGFISYQGKIRCDMVAMRFGPNSVSYGTGPLAAPVFGAPLSVSYGFSGPRVFVATSSPGGNMVDYVFTSRDEMGIDSWVGCKYRRVGSNAPSLAEHEAMQAQQSGQPVQHRVDSPAVSAAAAIPGPPRVLTYEESMDAIDKEAK